jgi:hypothetical protein
MAYAFDYRPSKIDTSNAVPFITGVKRCSFHSARRETKEDCFPARVRIFEEEDDSSSETDSFGS